MARSEITVQDVPYQSYLIPSLEATDATNGNMFKNDGETLLNIVNNSGGDITVTIYSVQDEAGRVEDQVVTVPTATPWKFAPLRPIWWNQRVTDIGYVYFDVSDDTNVTVAALKYHF